MKNPAQLAVGQWWCLYRVAAAPENTACAMDALLLRGVRLIHVNVLCCDAFYMSMP